MSRKQRQANESKIAFIGFRGLSFIFWNRALSMGYRRKKEKALPPAPLASRLCSAIGNDGDCGLNLHDRHPRLSARRCASVEREGRSPPAGGSIRMLSPQSSP
jgi:hypothetical protein